MNSARYLLCTVLTGLTASLLITGCGQSGSAETKLSGTDSSSTEVAGKNTNAVLDTADYDRRMNYCLLREFIFYQDGHIGRSTQGQYV